jgi:DNA helicase-2/ATP-dependent DNA helicase PcrA
VQLPSTSLSDLNPQQQAAVIHKDGPLLIIAGAGSGKTRVLTRRIAYLLANRGVAPYEVLAITFTNKAAGEMKERVAELVGPAARSMWVSTFHSACVRILRDEAPRLGYTKTFTIYDSADSRQLLKKIMDELKIDSKFLTVRTVQGYISQAKNELIKPVNFQSELQQPIAGWVQDIFAIYEQRLARSNAMDFDDLIGKTVEILQKYPEAKARYRSRFRHVLVDEYQDTNHAQYMMIRELVGIELDGIPMAELCVVGDADQSIYAFRGANIRNILQFETDYQSAKTILLEQNYRSTQNILTAANSVISRNQGRKDKNLWTEAGAGTAIVGFAASSDRDEADFICHEIQDLRKAATSMPGETAIFYRANAQSRVLEGALLSNGIPYKVVGGLKFYDRKEVKDFLGYLRVLVNPEDEVSLRRIINTPKRKIGDRSLELVDRFGAERGLTFWSGLKSCAETEELSNAAAGSIRGFVDLILEMQLLLVPEANLERVLNAVLSKSGLRSPLVDSDDPQDESRLQNLEELVVASQEFQLLRIEAGESYELSDFLESVSLVADADQIPDGEDHGGVVTLMTLHTAKGLEYPTVFLTGMEEGTFPHFRAVDSQARELDDRDGTEIEEERRLAYVGLTRARQRLYLSYSSYRFINGMNFNREPSRFLQEIPKELIEWRQHSLPSLPIFAGANTSTIRKTGPAPKATGVRTPNTLVLAVGDRVSHDTFGLGTVLAVDGQGDRAQATINFGSAGEKRLLLRYAPVERL